MPEVFSLPEVLHLRTSKFSDSHLILKEQKMNGLTPKKIVSELDKYIIGQKDAKRAVSIALRNRIRRQNVPEEMRNEITPKNILMIGPTGVGKTEIARRLSQIAKVPFLKIEVTKFTEVGYVGRDVESMIRDLTNLTINMVKSEATKGVEDKAAKFAEERILDILLPPQRLKRDTSKFKKVEPESEAELELGAEEVPLPEDAPSLSTREKLRKQLQGGKLENRTIEIETREALIPMIEIFAGTGMEGMDVGISDTLSSLLPAKVKRRKVTIEEARKILAYEEAQKLIDMDQVVKDAISGVEENGIIFLDELDKITNTDRTGKGPDVSREGVQRDLLPIVEGSTVITKYGPVRTDHILFIAAGTFHTAKPSDLIPELQGRFPIRVELNSLTKEDFYHILREPKNALVKQYEALLNTEPDVHVTFGDDAIEEMAAMAYKVNEKTENIGARRLHTIIERVVEKISFEAPDIEPKEINIDAQYVIEALQNIVEDRDLTAYIL